MNFLSKILASPQVQAGVISALIAGMVSVLVVWLTSRRNRRAQQAQRAEKLLLEVYNPIEAAFLNKKSLHSYVFHNKLILEKNRPNFSKKIRPLIDEALSQHYPTSGIRMGTTLDAKQEQEEKEAAKILDAKLKDIENRLRPLLADEIKRLLKLVDKG